MPQQPADDSPLSAAQSKRREQVHHDVVVIAGVERDVVTPRVDHGADNIDRLIAIERRDLDRGNIFDLGKLPPERVGQNSPAHRRLKIETDQRNHPRNLAAMIEHLRFACIAHRSETEQAGVISKIAGQCRRFTGRLLRFAADTGDLHQRCLAPAIGTGHFFRGQRQHRLEQTDARLANRKLRGVHAHRQPAGAGRDVITRQPPLPPLVELALAR